jgi:hypothetical protein
VPRAAPVAVFAHDIVDTQVLADSLLRIDGYVANNGLIGDGPYLAPRDLLLTQAPRLEGQPIRSDSEDTLKAAIRVAWRPRAPKNILKAHPPDQCTQFRVDWRPASWIPRLPAPVATKASPMPAQQCLGPHDHDGSNDRRKPSIQRDEE